MREFQIRSYGGRNCRQCIFEWPHHQGERRTKLVAHIRQKERRSSPDRFQPVLRRDGAPPRMRERLRSRSLRFPPTNRRNLDSRRRTCAPGTGPRNDESRWLLPVTSRQERQHDGGIAWLGPRPTGKTLKMEIPNHDAVPGYRLSDRPWLPMFLRTQQRKRDRRIPGNTRHSREPCFRCFLVQKIDQGESDVMRMLSECCDAISHASSAVFAPAVAEASCLNTLRRRSLNTRSVSSVHAQNTPPIVPSSAGTGL